MEPVTSHIAAGSDLEPGDNNKLDQDSPVTTTAGSGYEFFKPEETKYTTENAVEHPLQFTTYT